MTEKLAFEDIDDLTFTISFDSSFPSKSFFE
jgi:hypothetical protein